MAGNGKDSKPDIGKTPKIVRIKRPAVREVEAQGTASVRQVRSEDRKEKRPGLLRFTLIVLYKNLYILGITVLRRLLAYRRRLRSGSQGARGRALGLFARARLGLAGLWQGTVQRIKLPFVRIRNVRAQMQPVIEQSRKDGEIPLIAYGQIAVTFLRLLYDILRTLINYGAPIAAAVFLINYIGAELDKPMVLEVEYNGERLGYIQYEAEFESATRILNERFISFDEQMAIGTPTFRLVEESQTDLQPVSPKELANEIVRSSDVDIEWGYGLYIDNTFFGAVTESAPILEELESILESHAGTASKSDGTVLNEQVKFVKSIKLEDGLYPAASMVKQQDLFDVLYMDETVDEFYTVVAGDSPSVVSEKLGMSVSDLEAMNPGLAGRMVPGEQLRTQVAQPFLDVIITYTAVYQQEYRYPVEEIETHVYTSSYRKVEQEGVNGVHEVTAEISRINGVEVNRTITDTRVVIPAVPEKVIVGSSNPRGGGSASQESFMWPTDGGVVTVGLRGYYGHTGVDIPRPAGTNVYASRSGTVVLARNTYTGYGRYIMIDHGDGYVTLYAHNTSLYVNVGDYVSRGQVIASVGRTGNATGNHVHFEVRYYGQVMDPVEYIGR